MKLLRRLVILAAAVFILLLLSFASTAIDTDIMSNLLVTPEITFEDITVKYTPEGYTPKATTGSEELDSEIQYVAIEKSDLTPVSFPLINAGEYYVRAFLPATESYERVEVSATITIEPVEASIVVYYTKEKYNGIVNPPKWEIEPAWAADYITVDESYYAIDSYYSTEYAPVEKPKELGLYYTLLTPTNIGNNFICSQKAFVYEIGEERGDKLSYEEASSVLPSDFTCNLVETKVEYNGQSIPMPYTAYPAIVNYKIEYGLINYTGGSVEFSSSPPTEPGEYIVRASFLNKIVSESKLTIEKIKPIFIIENTEYEYTPLGIVPNVTPVHPTNLQYTVNAYLVDEESNTTVKAVDIPIKGVGRYLVIVNPVDQKHYEAVFESEYITINPAATSIIAQDQIVKYDGISKTPAYTVMPEWATATVKYYEVDEMGTVLASLGYKPPVYEGIYYAIIIVEGDENVVGSTAQIKFEIVDGGTDVSEESESNFLFLGEIQVSWFFFLIVLPLLLILGVVGYIAYTQSKSQK